MTSSNQEIALVGVNHESINAAVFLASVGWQVFFVADEQQVQQTLRAYHFDRQLLLLWQLYCMEQICLVPKLPSCPCYWLFCDGQSDWGLPLTPATQVILSGVGVLGCFEQIAQKLATNWVYYVPFNFLKDGNNFKAFFDIALLLVGQKQPNSHTHCEVITALVKNSQKQYTSDIKTIEFARASIIGMLATRVSYVNEMARLADSMGVNIHTIEAIMGADERIGSEYLKAGWGFGGHSLPKEMNDLCDKFAQNQVDTTLLKAVIAVNDDQKELIFRKFWQYFDGDIAGKTVVIWGAGYRAGASKTQGSAIHPLLKLFWAYEVKTYVCAHNTAPELSLLYPHEPLLFLSQDPYEHLKDSHALFVLNWGGKAIDVGRLNQICLPIFDAKNVFGNAERLDYQGVYVGIGC